MQTLYSLEQTLSLYEKMQRDGGDEMVTPQVRDLIAQYTCLSLDDAEIFMHNVSECETTSQIGCIPSLTHPSWMAARCFGSKHDATRLTA